MTCPSCQELIADATKRCPLCGTRIARMESGIVRTSAVLIMSDDVQAFYSSMRDVPAPLRKRVVASTTGDNSGTIVIADRRGKQEIEKAASQQKVPGKEPETGEVNARWRQLWPALVALLVGATGAWLAFVVRW